MPIIKSRYINNSKGAALITVLIVISLLTILGTALLMFSTTTFTTALKLTGGNKAFYLTDGAIEESLAEINEMVFDAEATANNHISEAFDFEDENILDVIDDGVLDGTFLAEEQWQKYLKKVRKELHNNHITEEEAMSYVEIGLRCEFLKVYYGVFLGSDSGLEYSLLNAHEDFFQEPEDVEAYVSDSINFAEIDSEALSPTKKNILLTLDINELVADVNGYNGEKNEDGTYEDVLKMTDIQSKFSEDEGLQIGLRTDGRFNAHKRAIELSVTVTEPKYQYIFKSAQEDVVVHNNEATDYALLAGKDLIVSGGASTIIGDAYAYGTYPSDEDIDSKKEIGGIQIGYKDESGNYLNNDMSGFRHKDFLSENGSLDVNGNLFTRSSVKINKAQNNLHVSKQLGANELRTYRYSADVDDLTSVEVNEHMYLYEDIVLRGDGQTYIRVGDTTINTETGPGDLYLILDSEGNAHTQGNHSGAITVQKNLTDKVEIDVNRLYIGGVSYSGVSRLVDQGDGTSNRTYYQTGESVSVENKYLHFYQTSYAQDHNYDGKIGSYSSEVYYTKFEDGQPVGSIGIELMDNADESNTGFKSGVFIGGATDGNFGAEASAIEDADKAMLKIRNLIRTNDYTNTYAYGVLLSKNSNGNGSVIPPNSLMGYSEYKDRINSIVLASDQRDVDRKMNIAKTRDITRGINLVYDYKKAEIGSDSALVENYSESRISQMVDFDENIIETEMLENIRIVNGNANKDIYVNPPSAINTGDISIGNSSSERVVDFGGTIATKGDVYIYAPAGTNVRFRGTLIAEGRVILYGPGTKEIEHDKARVNYQIAAYLDMGRAFYRDEGRSIENVLGYEEENLELQSRFHINESTSWITTYDNLAPIIAVIPYGETVSVSLDQPPILAGMQKNEGIKGYKIEYWRETRD